MYELAQLARMVNGTLDGPGDVAITGVAPIAEALPGDICMASEQRYLDMIPSTRASALLVHHDVEQLQLPAIRVDNPRAAFITLLQAFAPADERDPGIDEKAIVADTAVLGDNVYIGPYVTVGPRTRLGNNVVLHAGVRIGNDVALGDDTVVYPNAVIYNRSIIGQRVIIHANAVIGSDGYGFVRTENEHVKIPHIGKVEIGDDVEIGAAVTIDRATCGTTRIGRATKIGNLTQVAHNVQIGEACQIAGMSGIAGSSVLGDRVTLAGQVGVIDHVAIGNDAIVAARSMVAKNIPEKAFVSGIPARPHKTALREQAATARLPQTIRQVQRHDKKITALEQSLTDKTNDKE